MADAGFTRGNRLGGRQAWAVSTQCGLGWKARARIGRKKRGGPRRVWNAALQDAGPAPFIPQLGSHLGPFNPSSSAIHFSAPWHAPQSQAREIEKDQLYFLSISS